MKIDLNGAYRAYAKSSMAVSQQGEKASSKGVHPAAGQLDSISISTEAAQLSELNKMNHSAAAEADVGMSPEGLAELRQAVQSGSYHVPTEKLAEAVLNAYV